MRLAFSSCAKSAPCPPWGGMITSTAALADPAIVSLVARVLSANKP